MQASKEEIGTLQQQLEENKLAYAGVQVTESIKVADTHVQENDHDESDDTNHINTYGKSTYLFNCMQQVCLIIYVSAYGKR